MKLTWKQLKERVGLSNKNLMIFSMLRNIINSYPEEKEKIYVELFKTIMHPDTSEIQEINALHNAADKLMVIELQKEMLTNENYIKLSVDQAEELMAKNPLESGVALVPIALIEEEEWAYHRRT